MVVRAVCGEPVSTSSMPDFPVLQGKNREISADLS